MFMVSRDGAEDIYIDAHSYAMVDSDLVFYDAEDLETGRVVAFSQGEGNAVFRPAAVAAEPEEE